MTDHDEYGAVLLLIRTPFQAWLIEKIIELNHLAHYDLIYYTQNDSEEDRHYFDVLNKRARKSAYFYVKKKRFDILNHFCFLVRSLLFAMLSKYDAVYLSSIDSYAINSVASRKGKSKIFTFDDGTANYNLGSSYHNYTKSFKESLYAFFLRAEGLSSLKRKIVKHYTNHINKPNIVEKERLIEIDFQGRSFIKTGVDEIVFFIGAPFSEVLNSEEIERLELALSKINISYYVKHPREVELLNLNVPVLQKKGRIAEDAILKAAEGKNITLIGLTSSVMFNLEEVARQRRVLVPFNQKGENYLVEMARGSGCEIIFF